jgi:hypothetical protein
MMIAEAVLRADFVNKELKYQEFLDLTAGLLRVYPVNWGGGITKKCTLCRRPVCTEDMVR